jgi:DNA-binding transcriptional LysR family regulator
MMADNKRIQQLDLNLLKVFRSLYEEQNMTRTADALHLTPSAVSHAVRRLRDSLGDPLFQRANNRMVPTPACRRMAPLIIDNLSRLQQILQQWGQFDSTTSQYHFRIGMHDALEPSVLPKLAAAFADRAPSMRFSSVKVDRNNLARELSAGHIDVALDVALPIRGPVLSQKLRHSDFCVMLRRDHPLANKLNKRNYLDASHVSVSNRPVGMTMEDTFFQKKGLQRRSMIRCQNYLAATYILKSSDYLLTITKTMAEQLEDDEIQVLDMPFAIPSFATYLYWHSHTEEDAALSWLRKTIIGTC